MKSKKNIIEISEQEIPEKQPADVFGPEPEPTKQNKVLSDSQLESLEKQEQRQKKERKKERTSRIKCKVKRIKREKN